jgi:cytochrome c oxidase cbb3-type subunit III
MNCCNDYKEKDQRRPETDPARKQVCAGRCDVRKKYNVADNKVFLRVVLASLLLMTSLTTFAQQTSGGGSFWANPFNHPLLPLYLTLGFVALSVLLLVFVIIYLARALNIIQRQMEIDRAAKSGLTFQPSPSWFEKVWEKLNATVPVAQEADIDLGHSYDGIRELDNHLPPWWKGLFYFTVIWGAVYLVLYHVTPVLPLQGEEYANELSAAEDQARALAASRPKTVIDENALVFTSDEAIISKGKTVFANSNCGSCHRLDGGGNNIGPNLTDDYWIHGGSIKNVFHTVKEGVVEKGMPAWGKTMSAEDVKNVAFYVMSLRGTNPADAKKPQGDLFRQEETVPLDTGRVRAALN